MPDKFENKDSSRLQSITTVVSLGFAALALVISGATWLEQEGWLFPGEVRFVSPPIGYAVYRGVDSFPSDHLAIPMSWQNSTRYPATIVNPRLLLSGDNKTYDFPMVGELPEISNTAIGRYIHGSWAVLQPQSVSVHVMVFAINDWWNEANEEHYKFHFLKQTPAEIRAVLEYSVIQRSSQTKQSILFKDKLPLYEGINKIQEHGYDFFWF